jgi:hypothetical protein
VAFGPALQGDIGTFDTPNLGLSFVAAWIPTPVRLELSGAYWLTQTINVPAPPPNPPRGGRLDLLSAALQGCYAFVTKPIEISPCAGIELGIYRGTAFGVSEIGSNSTFWGAFLWGGLLAWHVAGPFALRATLEAVSPLTRPTFQIGGVGSVHKPASLSGRAGIGLELRF